MSIDPAAIQRASLGAAVERFRAEERTARELWQRAFDDYPHNVVGRICRYVELMEQAGHIVDLEHALPTWETVAAVPAEEAT